LLSLLALPLAAQTSVNVAFQCSPQDVESFGLYCTEDEPCPVLLELASAGSAGNRVFVAGNLHTRDTTLFGLLLASEDGGLTWTEPIMRLRNAALEQMDFYDQQTGWISGEALDPLARDPFLLLTSDGGKTWRQKALFDDTKYGTVAQFHFDSVSSGELVLDASQGKATRQELYATMTGGESWEVKQVSNVPLRLKNARPADAAGWRVRADASSSTYRLEKGAGRKWQGVASFKIHVTDCR
jgi:photosystem II stability/assembly factor-like uncharacterized protein